MHAPPERTQGTVCLRAAGKACSSSLPPAGRRAAVGGAGVGCLRPWSFSCCCRRPSTRTRRRSVSAVGEPAPGRAQRRVARSPPRQLAGERGRALLLQLKAAKKGGPQLKTCGRRPRPGRVRVRSSPPGVRVRAARAAPCLRGPNRSSRIPCPEKEWVSHGTTRRRTPPVLVTTFRTELDYPRIVAYVAWFDHTRTALAFPGRYEPPSPCAADVRVPGQRWRLYAPSTAAPPTSTAQRCSINGLSYEPLKDGLATLIGYRNGRVAIKTWHGGPNAGPTQVALARQSLPPDRRERPLDPALNDSSQWGRDSWERGIPCLAHRRPGSTVAGDFLIYAAADYQTVTTLAEILLAGAVQAMRHIDPEWPSLITYSHVGGLGPTASQRPAVGRAVPGPRRPRLLRRLPAPARPDHGTRSSSLRPASGQTNPPKHTLFRDQLGQTAAFFSRYGSRSPAKPKQEQYPRPSRSCSSRRSEHRGGGSHSSQSPRLLEFTAASVWTSCARCSATAGSPHVCLGCTVTSADASRGTRPNL